MARITLQICDLCKQDRKDSDKGIGITIGKGKIRRGDLCETCFKNIESQLDASLAYTPPAAIQLGNKSGMGEIVPSAGKTPVVSKKAAPRQCARCDGSGKVYLGQGNVEDCPECKKAKCTHDRKSFEENKTVCKDCGQVLPIF